MFVLRIEHTTSDYDKWKQLFDSDPVDRAGKGVRRHYVSRAVDEPSFVSIELAFDTEEQANALLDAMRGVWSRMPGDVISAPSSRIFEVAEEQAY
jgi:hypothetical protein